MSKPYGVLRFLGTNCDRDVFAAAETMGLSPEWLWYADRFEPTRYDGLLIPGGFSHGDYLRCGALAAKAPAMDSVRAAAGLGTPVLGICNGFQILCEAGLLPGALVRNEKRRFIDRWAEVKLQNENFWSRGEGPGRRLRLPVAHGEGRYYVDGDALKRLHDQRQIWCTYEGKNLNGSVDAIAGVSNERGNVAGLMPHPERAMHDWMGGADGRAILGRGA